MHFALSEVTLRLVVVMPAENRTCCPKVMPVLRSRTVHSILGALGIAAAARATHQIVVMAMAIIYWNVHGKVGVQLHSKVQKAWKCLSNTVQCLQHLQTRSLNLKYQLNVLNFRMWGGGKKPGEDWNVFYCYSLDVFLVCQED